MPLDQVLVIKATNLTTGYSFVGIDSDRGSVWDASKSAYGTTISAASFALGGNEICSTKRRGDANGSLHYLVEPTERSAEARAKARYEATASKLW